MFGSYKSSNPAFNSYFWKPKTASEPKMSILGIFLKSIFCLILVIAATAIVWKLFYDGQTIKWYTTGGMITAIVISLILSIRQQWAAFLVPIYAIAKGLFLGGFSVYIHKQYPNFPFQAVGISLITFLVFTTSPSVFFKASILAFTSASARSKVS